MRRIDSCHAASAEWERSEWPRGWRGVGQIGDGGTGTGSAKAVDGKDRGATLQDVYVFVKPDCPKCRHQERTLRRLVREHPRVTVFDVYQDKLETEIAGVTETPTAIVTWDGVEQYRTTNLLELM